MNGFEKCRLRAGLTQVEVAEALHVAQPTVSLWETGKTFPPGAKIPSIARLYGCRIDDLYEGATLKMPRRRRRRTT